MVGEIPRGKVATYGQIASLVGRPKNARLVGKILSQVDLFGTILAIESLMQVEDLYLDGLSKRSY